MDQMGKASKELLFLVCLYLSVSNCQSHILEVMDMASKHEKTQKNDNLSYINLEQQTNDVSTRNVENRNWIKHSRKTFPGTWWNISDLSLVMDFLSRHTRKKRADPLYIAANTGSDSQFSPCSVAYDGVDIVVDCSSRSLTNVNSTWFPPNTTIISLDDNELTQVPDLIFSHLENLRKLSMANNKIENISPNAFGGLNKLENLNLEFNKMGPKYYSKLTEILQPLINLRELGLVDDVDEIFISNNFSLHFLKQLQKLEMLSVDAPGETLHLGNEFLSLKNLINLRISGNSKFIDNTSFENVKSLTEFVINDFPSLSNFSEEALEYLQNLDVLAISNAYIGVESALRLLKPLVRRNISTIYFCRVSYNLNEDYSSILHNDGILDSIKTKYLLEICVKNFSLIHSQIRVVKRDAFYSETWNRCLKTFDISENNVVGIPIAFVRMFNMKSIENFAMEFGLKQCYFGQSFANGVDKRLLLQSRKKRLQSPDHITFPNLKENNKSESCMSTTSPRTEHMEQDHRNFTIPVSLTKTGYQGDGSFGYFSVSVSESLQTVKMGSTVLSTVLHANIRIVGARSLRYLNLQESGFSEFQGNIIGLSHLKSFILSGNDMSSLSVTFFDDLCSLEELDLSTCKLDPQLIFTKSYRIFQNLVSLKRLDISLNLLYMLESSTFAENRNLEELDLSKNRFQHVPFKLQNTLRLKYLDLSDNSITMLDQEETENMDKLAMRPAGFRLFLSGNILSCGCRSMRFLVWLRETRVHLDNKGNFTCMTDTGELSYTGSFSDIEGLWRKCSGEFFLSLAVSLLLTMLIGFLSFLLVWRNKTFIKSAIIKMVAGYKIKELADYKIGVFIGYADDDYKFPCFVLRKFIEEKLGLSTYVHHRDMNPASDMASSILEAVSSSWRIVLVFSESFLQDNTWSTFTYRSALYAQTPLNPARLVLLVDEDLQQTVPNEVFSSVFEDNIIVVSQWQMSYHLRQKLRMCLKP